ncbi:MAG: DUF58 domain-containing protein [Acidobacteriota bacterium]
MPGSSRNFLVLAVAVLLLLALLYRQPAHAYLALYFAFLLITCWRLSRRGLKGLTARRVVRDGAFEDDEVDVKIQVDNLSDRDVAFLEVADRFGPALAPIHVLPNCGPLPSGARRVVGYRSQCSKLWGLHSLGPLRLATHDPAGLFRRATVLPDQAEFTVFPKVHHVEGLLRLGGLPSLTVQEVSAGRSGQSHLYLGVREHVAGDDPRRIHWPASARTGKLMQREHEVDLVPYLTLFLDLESRHRAGTGRKSTLEYVVRAGSSILATASREGQHVQVIADTPERLVVPPGRGEDHLAWGLDRIIRLVQDGRRPFLSFVGEQLSSVPPGSTAVLLCASHRFVRAELELLADRLGERGVRPALVLVDQDSFMAIHGRDDWHGEELTGEEARAVLERRGGTATLLTAEDDLELRLREGLFP